MSSGGQRSSSSGGSAESVAAGCMVRELRPKSRQPKGSEIDGYAVFTFGRGEDGQLGLGDTCDSDEPKFVDALRGVGVSQISCGSGHSVVLTSDGEVYSWGRGDDGRLVCARVDGSICLFGMKIFLTPTLLLNRVMAIMAGNMSLELLNRWQVKLWSK